MNILLTGGRGFTGNWFKRIAEEAGHKVWQLAADIRDKNAVVEEVNAIQPTEVVHLAAISSVTHHDERSFYDVNVLGSMNLLNALAGMTHVPSKVLLLSSANVYGNCVVPSINETQVPSPVNHYATSKLAMEHMAMTLRNSLPLIIARPFNYTGRGQAENFLIPKMVRHFTTRSQFIELGNLGVEREFNDVRMVCEAYLRLLSFGEIGEIYNICSGRSYSLKEILDVLSSITSHELQVRVDKSLIRENEVMRLTGDPEKLLRCVGNLTDYTLQDTLSEMLRI